MATEFISNSWLMPTNANAEANRVSNYSLDFDGTSQYISINSSILSAAGDMTVSAWVKFNDTTSLQGIFESANYYTTGFNGGFGLRANGIGLSAAFSNGTSFDYNIEPAGFTIGNWFQVAFTFNNTSKLGTYYVDGSSIGTYTFNSAYDNADLVNGAELGRVIKNSGFILNGNLTEVSIFDYELSAPQVTELYGTGSAIGNPMAITNGRKPVAYYPLGNAGFNSEFLVPNGAEQDYVFDFVPNDFINCGSSINITSNFSYSFWYRSEANSYGSYEFLLSRENAPASIKQFNIYNVFTSTGRILANIYDSSGTAFGCDTGSGISENVWHHIAFCYSPSNYIRLYLDGVLEDENTSSIPASIRNVVGENLRIGGRGNNSMFLNGQMSNVLLWDATLTDGGVSIGDVAGGDISTLYNYGTPYKGTQPQAANLQGWWELDASATFDGSNWSIPDASSNSNTGTSSGMTAASLIQSDLIINQSYDPFSLDFDGTDDYIEVANNSSLQITDNLTLSCWINADNVSATNSIIDKFYDGADRSYLLRISGTRVKLYLGNTDGSSAPEYQSSLTLSNNVWYHVVTTFSSTDNEVKIYINGSLDSTHSKTDLISSNNEELRIGTGYNLANYFNGKLSNCSIYSSSLTSAQVKTLYNEGKPFNLNNFAVTPVSWWRLGAVNSSYNSTSSEWTILDEIGTNNGTSANMTQSDLVDGVGATGSGTSSGMSSGTNRTGDAPYSDNNAVSYNMSVTAKSTSVPT